MTNYTNTYTHLHMHAESSWWHNNNEWHSLLVIYTSHFIWKGCVWEGVGDQTELQHIDPHSIGHNRVSFLFFWAAQPEAWGPSSLWVLAFSIASCHQWVWSSKLWFLSSPTYIIVQCPPSCGRHKLHSFNPSTVNVIISWSTGWTCYLQRCISYFDNPAGS